MIYGYARCSTNESKQDIDRQKRELQRLGVTTPSHIYWEYESGSNINRTELNKLLTVATKGDTIVTTEVSRITRSTQHLCTIINLIQAKNLILNIGGSFVLDCSQGDMDPMTEGIIKMWGVFSEMERNIISQRVKSGILNAKSKGKKIGRPKIDKSNIPDKFFKYYNMYIKKQISISEIAKLMNCSRTTIYKYIKIAEL